MKNLYVDIHVLQTVPSANINRDDTGAPKKAIYGGVTRARVSSQSWKRATRKLFAQEDLDWLKSYRTKEAPSLLTQAIIGKSDLDQETAAKKAENIFNAASVKIKEGKTSALMLVSQGQIEKLAQFALDHEEFEKEEKKAIKELFNSNQSLDLALFGRMVADNPELNVDAASQVAHAISTHEITPEFDYFTALDDLQADDQSGAAMIDNFEYNSATLYRYANVNVSELIHNLDEELALKGIELFIKDFVESMPDGKQNSFANKTVPQYLMVTVREDTPVNLASAFEEPVVSRDGYLRKSVDKLENEYELSQKFVEKPVKNFILSRFETKVGEEADNLPDLIEKVSQILSGVISDEDVND